MTKDQEESLESRPRPPLSLVSECPAGSPAPESRVHTPPASDNPEAVPKTPPGGTRQSVAQPTPNHARASGAYAFNSTAPRIYAEQNQKNMHRETRGFFLGPMPVDQFLDAFLPVDDDDNASQGIEFEYDDKWKHENQMYRPLVTAIEKLGLSELCFCVTANSGDPDWVIEGLAPDISGYHKDKLENGFRERQFKPDDGKTSQCADFAIMDLSLEIKPKLAYDSFKDPENGDDLTKHRFVKSDKRAQKVLGQMCAYAAAQMGMAFRTHCFSVFIARDTARVIRWDRAGAVVTRSFNYVQYSGLARFLKRYAALSPAQRGWDQTAIPLPLDSPETIGARNTLIQQRFNDETEEEFQKRRAYLTKARYYKYLVPVLVTSIATESVQHLQKNRPTESAPILRERLATDPAPTFQERRIMEPVTFIGPFPRRWACSLLGRNSRGTPIFNPENGMIHWLKDIWRIDMEMVKKEHESYEKMEQCNVRNLIPIVSAGDMREVYPCRAVYTNAGAFSETISANPNFSPPKPADKMPVRGPAYNSTHYTITDKLIDASWVSGNKAVFWRIMIGYCHYRIVLLYVGRDLTSFPSTTILLRAFADAMTCHSDAHFRADVLHRDISPSNILLMDDGTGRLIDWDLCRHGQQGDSHRPGRTGAWQFISGNLLENPDTKVHDYVDDLESFLHSLTYTLVRFSSSSLGSAKLPKFLSRFDEEYDEAGMIKGGQAKRDKLRGRDGYVEDLDFPGRNGLSELLLDFAALFLPVYATARNQDDANKAQIRALDTEEGGGLKISEKVHELLKRATDSWVQDERAKEVELPLPTTHNRTSMKKRSRIPSQPVSHMSSVGLSGTIDSILEEDGVTERAEGEQEERKPKRVRSDSPFA